VLLLKSWLPSKAFHLAMAGFSWSKSEDDLQLNEQQDLSSFYF
jgi:hypothetical protein